MKLLGLLLVMGVLLLGGGYWWWSTRPTLPLEFTNTQTLTVDQLPASSDRDQMSQSREVPSSVQSTTLETPTPQSLTPQTPAPPNPTSIIDITPHLINFGFRTPPSARSIDTIVVHSSYNASGGDTYNLEKIIGQYEQYGVGAHYIIDRSGKIYQLVRESNIAYHAGESKMPDGRKNVNDFSVGIELIGTEDSGFSDKQYASLNNLIADIKTRHTITHIVGHSDIAPNRKTDPWKFDWKRLK